MIKRISRISKWLISVTKSVLKPLLLSTLFRHLYFFAHLLTLFLGGWMLGSLFADANGKWIFPLPLWGGILVLITLTLFKAFCNYLEHFLGHLVAFKALEILRVEFYRSMLPIATQNMHQSGDLLLRATKDIDRIEVFYAHTFAPAVTAITVPVITLCVTGPFVGWAPSMIAACGLLLSIFLVPALGIKRSFASAQAASTVRAEIAQHVTDSIQGMAEVTGYGHTQERLTQLRDLDLRLGKKQNPRGNWTAIRNCSAVLISLMTTLGVAATGVQLQVPLVHLGIFTVLVWSLFGVTAGVRDFAADLDNSLAAAERVYDIAQTSAQVEFSKNPVALPAGALAIKFNNVSYYYPNHGAGTRPALDQVSFDIPAGSHTCLIGASGCGKSTILKLVARHFDPSHGAIQFSKVPLTDISQKELRRVLLVEQTATLFNMSVAENLRLAVPEADDEDLLNVLELVELRDELAPRGGLDLQVGASANLLSGGQRQRLALARAILLHPDVLLLDEYTSHLDPTQADRVRDRLRRTLPGLTILESTHSPASLTQTDQVIVLDNGQIQAIGTLQQIRGSAVIARLMAREADAHAIHKERIHDESAHSEK